MAWIEGSPAAAFLLLTLLYIVVVVSLSSFKLLWLDELITLHIARLQSVTAIWHALAEGADPNPPVTHLLVYASRRIFGEHEFALRLPIVIGYWIGMASLFAYLIRRIPTTWALAGTILSMTMAAFDYSYESRSYGIFYGLAMLAFACWSNSIDSRYSASTRWTAFIGMTFALALGVSTNYFAVLAFLPIAAGELARTLVRFNRDRSESRTQKGTLLKSLLYSFKVRTWIGLILGAMPLLAFRRMIAHSIAEFSPFAWNKVSWEQVTDSYTEMVEIALYPLLFLMLTGVVFWLLARLCSGCRSELRPRWVGRFATQMRCTNAVLPIHESVGVLFLMAYPILGYIVARVHGGMLSPRFVIPVCFGFAIAGTLTAFRLFGHIPRAGIAFVCLCMAWFLTREAVVGYWYSEQKQCFYKVLAHLPEAEISGNPNAPIAIPDPLLALTFQHYAPAAIAAREVFPVDFPAIRNLRGDDSPEENLWAGRNSIYTLPILTLADFQSSVSDYLIIASDGNWMTTDLNEHRYPVERLDINTRAGAIGGFTPLCHGVPVFFLGTGDRSRNYVERNDTVPTPFNVRDNMPNGSTSIATRNGKEKP